MPLMHMNAFAKPIARLASATLLALAAAAAGAQDVGRVTFVQGVTSAQAPGQDPRFLAQGDAIRTGEIINTSGRGYAVVSLADGTKMTLRSNTTFVIDALNRTAGEESLLMRLVRGGLRSITGSISKARPNAARLSTPTATVGIRGTEFDARICGLECRREAQYAPPGPAAASQDAVVARLVALRGTASAVTAGGTSRALANGAAVFNGESIRTAADSHAVLAFRDQTKVTLLAQTDFRLEDVRFPPAQAAQGNYFVRLLSGGLRAVTGTIARASRSNVRFVTPTATVGIRGTGIDIMTTPDGTQMTTWDGAASLEGGGGEVVVVKDRAAQFHPARGAPHLLDAIPQAFLDQTAPRPDTVDVDFETLFAVRRTEDYAPGLYLGMRDGHANMAARGGVLDLGPLEAGALFDGSDTPVRIEPLPGFLFNDPFPIPDDSNLRPMRLIEILGPGRDSGSDQCLLQ